MDTSPFPSFAPLLDACAKFAELSGGRYTRAMFSDLRGDDCKADRARVEAMPTVADFAERISSGSDSASLQDELHVAERMVLREAVFTSMMSTCRSLDLWPSRAAVDAEDITYQDMSEPLEHVSQRLYNFVRLRRTMGEEGPHWSRMLAATFIVEFGREHGLQPSEPDPMSQRMLMEFLVCVKEWGQRMKKQEVCLQLDEALPPSLRDQAQKWWKDNWKSVAVGGAALVAGAALLGIGMALASSIGKRTEADERSRDGAGRKSRQ